MRWWLLAALGRHSPEVTGCYISPSIRFRPAEHVTRTRRKTLLVQTFQLIDQLTHGLVCDALDITKRQTGVRCNQYGELLALHCTPAIRRLATSKLDHPAPRY